LLPPDAIFKLEMHRNAFSAGALAEIPLGSLQRSTRSEGGLMNCRLSLGAGIEHSFGTF